MARKNKENAPKKKSKVVYFIFVFLFIALGAVVALKFDDIKILYHNAVDMFSEMITPTEYQGMTKKEPYKIAYVSNGDGTCYVSKIITNPLYEEYYTLEIPETSPDGDKVTAIKSSGFLGSLIAPMMLEEDFESYIKKPLLKLFGDEDNFYFKQFMSYWQLKGLEYCSTEEVRKELISHYPIVQYENIYVFDPIVTPVEVAKREDDIRLYIPEFTPEQAYMLMEKMMTLSVQKRVNNSGSMKAAFEAHTGGGTMIQKIILPDTLEYIGSHAFAGCSSVGYIDIPDGVMFIGDHAFACCESLVDIDIPQGVTEIKKGTYMGCHNLVNLVIPNHIVSIEAEAFSDCAGLISVRIPQSVQSVDETAFRKCMLIEVYNASKVSHDVFGDINVYSQTEGESKLITSGDFIFYYNEKNRTLCLAAYLGTETDIVLPSSVEINGKIFEEYAVNSGAFYCDRNITSIVMPDAVMHGVSLYKCESLKSITIPRTETNWLFEAFISCRNLKEITFEGTQKQWEAVYGDEERYTPRLNEYTVHCSDGDVVMEKLEFEYVTLLPEK